MGTRSIVVALLVVLGVAGTAGAETYHVYYLGGQSNMDGYGRVSELPASLREPMDGVMIYHGNPGRDRTPPDGRGRWTTLGPGHGGGYATDGETERLSDAFGPELGFARRMQALRPNERIAIIKYSMGGTSIDERAGSRPGRPGSWDPHFTGGEGAGRGVNHYDHFLATVRSAMAVRDIDGDGTEDRLIPAGIVWMQGESDAMDAAVAADYEANLRELMMLMRAAFRDDALPIVIGRISDSGQDPADGVIWTHGDVVRAAQAAVAEADPMIALVTTTDDYGYSDPYHYDTAGYLDLGRAMAEAAGELRARREREVAAGN